MEKFKLKLHLKSGIPEVDEYIKGLEDYVQDVDTSAIKQLIMSLNELAVEMSNDIYKISKGETDNLTILSDDKDSKVFDRVMAVIGKVKDFKELTNIATSMIPEIEQVLVESKEAPIKLDPSANLFEQAQKKILDRRNGRTDKK